MQKPVDLLSIKEAAAALSLSVPTIHRLVASGVLPKPLKLGRSSRWLASDLVDFIDQADRARK